MEKPQSLTENEWEGSEEDCEEQTDTSSEKIGSQQNKPAQIDVLADLPEANPIVEGECQYETRKFQSCYDYQLMEEHPFIIQEYENSFFEPEEGKNLKERAIKDQKIKQENSRGQSNSKKNQYVQIHTFMERMKQLKSENAECRKKDYDNNTNTEDDRNKIISRQKESERIGLNKFNFTKIEDKKPIISADLHNILMSQFPCTISDLIKQQSDNIIYNKTDLDINYHISLSQIYQQIKLNKDSDKQKGDDQQISLSPLINYAQNTESKQQDEELNLSFNSQFEGGNLAAASKINKDEYLLILQNDVNSRGHTQWFYFQVSGGKSRQKVRFNILNLKKKKSLFQKGMQVSVFSTQKYKLYQKGWHSAGSEISYTSGYPFQILSSQQRGYLSQLSFTYEFDISEDQVFFSYSIPYSYSKLNSFLKKAQLQPISKSSLKIKTLTHTISNNRIPIVTISSPQLLSSNQTQISSSLNKNPQTIIITARVHPGETVSSFVAEGIIEFLLSDSNEAKVLRDNFIFKIIPMLNPDGVIHGNSRCSLSGQDLNRRWTNPSKNIHPEILAAKQTILNLHKDHKVALFMDLHGHSRKTNIFAYGCHNPSEPFSSREFPFLISKIDSCFSFRDCSFNMDQERDGTARIQMSKCLQIPNVFTIESSFFGSSEPFTPQILKNFGKSICKSILIQFPFPIAPQQTLNNYSFSQINGMNSKQQILDELYSHPLPISDSYQSEGSDSNPSDDNLSDQEQRSLYKRSNKSKMLKKQKENLPKRSMSRQSSPTQIILSQTTQVQINKKSSHSTDRPKSNLHERFIKSSAQWTKPVRPFIFERSDRAFSFERSVSPVLSSKEKSSIDAQQYSFLTGYNFIKSSKISQSNNLLFSSSSRYPRISSKGRNSELNQNQQKQSSSQLQQLQLQQQQQQQSFNGTHNLQESLLSQVKMRRENYFSQTCQFKKEDTFCQPQQITYQLENNPDLSCQITDNNPPQINSIKKFKKTINQQEGILSSNKDSIETVKEDQESICREETSPFLIKQTEKIHIFLSKYKKKKGESSAQQQQQSGPEKSNYEIKRGRGILDLSGIYFRSEKKEENEINEESQKTTNDPKSQIINNLIFKSTNKSYQIQPRWQQLQRRQSSNFQDSLESQNRFSQATKKSVNRKYSAEKGNIIIINSRDTSPTPQCQNSSENISPLKRRSASRTSKYSRQEQKPDVFLKNIKAISFSVNKDAQ